MMRKFLTLISIAICGFGFAFSAVPALADLEDDYRDFPSDINLFDPDDPSDVVNPGGGSGGGGGGGGGGTVDEFECADGIDNDGDGLIDYGEDPDCSSPFDDTESGSIGGGTTSTGGGGAITRDACADGVDNDGDGLIDFGRDPGCSSWTDNDETDEADAGDVGGGDGAPEDDSTPVLPSTGPADAFLLALIIAAGVTYTTKKYKLQ